MEWQKPFTINPCTIFKRIINCIEVRSVDPAANPYMALAAILEAGLDGIKNKLKVPEPVNQNIYEMNREEREAVGIQDLPSTLYTALKAMRENEVIKKASGNHIYNQFINSKSIEWDYYRTQVSEWEKRSVHEAILIR
ncbi:hypothetical protein UM764_09785 [Staphylococcus aureus]|nr:hypothetical protein UM764_09785 [Staphylococcus aureus]WRN72566.1 hypothetical protein UM582_12680 [Staphylococcus aureus]